MLLQRSIIYFFLACITVLISFFLFQCKLWYFCLTPKAFMVLHFIWMSPVSENSDIAFLVASYLVFLWRKSLWLIRNKSFSFQFEFSALTSFRILQTRLFYVTLSLKNCSGVRAFLSQGYLICWQTIYSGSHDTIQ